MRGIVRLGLDRIEELALLNKQLIEDEDHSNSMTIKQLGDRMKDWLESGYTCVALEENGQILCYSLWRDDGEYFYLRHLFTRREHRRKGLARELVDHLENHFFNEKPVRLEVLTKNGIALRFYESLGYEIYAHTLQKAN